MFQITRIPPRKAWFPILAALLPVCASAQDFTMRVTDPNPLGLGVFVPIVPLLPMGPSIAGGAEGGIKGAFGYGLGVNTTYDSNFNLSENDEESEYYASLTPWLRYVSDPEGGAPVSLIANYSPSINAYLENSDLNEVNHSADVALSFTGSRTNASLFGSYNQIAGSDRLTNSFVTGSLFSGGLQANRQIAPRTSLSTSLTYSKSTYDSGDLEGTGVFTGYAGGMWDATSRLGLGTSLRYTRGDSDNSGVFEAWALLAEGRFRASERIWLSASVGPEISSDSGSDNNLSIAVDITARYLINERWSWTNSMRTATVSAPDEAGYVVNNYFFNTGLQRQFNTGAMSTGLEYNFSEYETVGDITGSRDDEQNLALFLAYYRPLFSERLGFNSMIRYTLNDGERDWKQLMVSLGVNVSF
jgi:hypothetical protein